MKIAVASGKGGTGKTTVCASLASIWESPVIAADFDVEEPNLHLFLNPKIEKIEKSYAKIPVIDSNKCNGCGDCVKLCRFNALTIINNKAMVFPEMCHSCEGCSLVCKQEAITYGKRELGEISFGKSGNIDFIMGRLRIGEAMSPPLMREMKKLFFDTLEHKKQSGSYIKKDVIIDSPPGASCPAINAVIDADYIILVTEPTPFGFNDLKIAREAFETLKKPMGVVVNRAGLGDSSIYNYCKLTNLRILTEIPFDKKIAEAYSNGEIIANMCDKYRDIFISLAREVISYA